MTPVFKHGFKFTEPSNCSLFTLIQCKKLFKEVKEVLGYLLEELSTEEEPSDCLEEFHLEEFNIRDDFSGATGQINFRNMRQEFRADRRQLRKPVLQGQILSAWCPLEGLPEAW
jgi:hypothetical protein